MNASNPLGPSSAAAAAPSSASTHAGPTLFSPLTVRGVTMRNRIGVSPMCQYSSTDGFVNDWHLVHLASRAVGGAGLVMTEATAVEARGRISPSDAGIYSDAHIEPWARIVAAIKSNGAVPGMQIAHAGRKASTREPGKRKALPVAVADAEGGWEPVGASAIAFDSEYRPPRELSPAELRDIAANFGRAAARARKAGFEWLEIHAGHGYLLHSFFSPLANRRTDAYGGSFDNRTRLMVEVVQAVRAEWPSEWPLAVRFSCSDWVEGGWTIDDSVRLATWLKLEGVDLIDCSSGFNVPKATYPQAPGWQVPFAERIRREAHVATAAVGLITEPAQAEAIVASGQADIVLLAREMLRNPYWAWHAAQALGRPTAVSLPEAYDRAARR